MSGTTGVFVDDNGRRSRWIARAGRLVGAACVIYLVVIVASLFGATWVPRVALPGVGRVVPSTRPVGALVLPPTAAHTPFPAPALTHPPGSSVPPPVSAPAGAVSSTVSPATTQAPGRSGSAPGHDTTIAPTASTTAPTTAAPTAGGTTTSAPTHGRSTTAPGRTRKGG